MINNHACCGDFSQKPIVAQVVQPHNLTCCTESSTNSVKGCKTAVPACTSDCLPAGSCTSHTPLGHGCFMLHCGECFGTASHTPSGHGCFVLHCGGSVSTATGPLPRALEMYSTLSTTPGCSHPLRHPYWKPAGHQGTLQRSWGQRRSLC